MLLHIAESDPLYTAFKRAFPDASPVDIREARRRLGRDDVDTVELMQLDKAAPGAAPMGGYLCTVAPRYGHSGVRIHVKVKRVTIKTSDTAAWGQSESVSLQDIQKLMKKVPTSGSR